MPQSIVTSPHLSQALSDATTCAKTKYPAEEARIQRGLEVALSGRVTILADKQIALVQSRSRDGIVYQVNGHCQCEDFSRAPSNRCLHRWAVALLKKATLLLSKTYYASVAHPAGMVHGVATIQADGTIRFQSDNGTEIVYEADAPGLALGGRIDLADVKAAEEAPLWQRHAVSPYVDKRAAVAQYQARKQQRI